MPSSRARKRIAAVAAAIPVLVAGGPFSAPALASDPYVVTNLLTDGQAVGPNSGYLGLGAGQGGSTAMFKIAPTSPSATISGLELTLTQLDNPGTFIYQNEFDATDGLALYADVNDNGEFDATDKATGLRSSGYRAGRPQANGDIPFVLSFNSPASGSDEYFVTIHPAAVTTARPDRRFGFKVDVGNVAGSGGSGPVALVSTPLKVGEVDKRPVLDVNAPVPPARSAFTATNKIPGEEDTYSIAPGTVAETSAKIAFFNVGDSNVSTGALLTRPGFDPTKPVTSQLDKVAFQSAVNTADPTAANVVPIGDGSGIVKNVTTVAKNNQLSNAVFARLIDGVGNLSAPVVLSDCFVDTGQSACEPARGNPVIGPDAPSSVNLSSGGTAIAGINIANEASVPLQVTSASTTTDARTTRNTASATNADTSSRAVKVEARIVQLTGAGAVDPQYGTAAKEKSYSTATPTSVAWSGTDGFDTRLQENAPKGIQEGSAIAQAAAINFDRAGNPSALVSSTTKFTKDITAPTLTVSTSKTTTLARSDVVSLQFSEPMTPGNLASGAKSEVTQLCPDAAGDGSAEKVLDIVDDAAGNADRTWGLGYCYEWVGSTNTSAKITIGDKRPNGCDENTQTPDPVAPPCVPYPTIGDLIRFAGAGTNQLTDKAGNLIVGVGPAPHHTTLITPPPAPLAGETKDANLDGVLDGVLVNFTSEMSLSSMRAKLSQFSAVGPTTVPITDVTFPVPTDEKQVLFSFVSDFNTGEQPQIRLSVPVGATETGVLDKGNRPVAAFSLTPADKAIPLPKRALTIDDSPTRGDGKVDRIRLEYSEPIQHAKDNNPAANNVFGRAYFIPAHPGPVATGAPPGSEGRNIANPKTGNGSVKLVDLQRANSNFDTATTTYTVKFTRFTDQVNGNAIFGPTDLANNVWGDSDNEFIVPAGDGTAPFYVSRHTRDLDGDGRVDAIDVKFTENIPTESAGASFTVTGHQIVDQYPLSTDGIRIEIDETAAPGTGDTNVMPTIQYLGGVKDVLGNAMTPDPAPVATTDGAGPAIIAACPSSPKGFNGTCPEDDPTVETDDGTRMNVFFSEPLNTGTVLPADFTVEQPAGATPAKTVANVNVTNAPDGKSATATLSFTQGTLSNTLDSVVRFSGAGVVADNATPNVVSTQTANIAALAPPTVDLALSCPTPTTNPQYCGSTTIGTGATGSTAVTKWRLKNTARGTIVDPAEYSSTRPDTITLVEGSHTLFLSGLDGFGRLSPEVSKTINILTAPKILNLQFQNAATPRAKGSFPANTTVVDGDTVHIGADAYGTDAEEWAEDGAPTDGGCLREHMSINLKPLTNDSADDSVPPTTCDLHTTGEQPRRAMVFPTAKVSDTTRYPVGTVLKVSDSDPGSLIVDGSGGTIARRKFISVNARRSWMITDASVIRVPTHLVAEIPAQTKRIGYRDGAILRDSTGRYYYSLNGAKHPVSTSRLSAWRIPTSTAYRPSATELKAMPTSSAIGGSNHPTGTWVKFSSGATYQIVRNSKGALVRRQLGSTAALRTLVPTSHVYAGNSYDAKIPVDTTWLRGYRDGTVLVWRDSAGKITKTGVIARGSLRMFASNTVFNTLGFNVSNGLPASFAAMPRVPGKSYFTGTPIDRYALGEIVMRVTNKAGAAVTAAVPNSSGLFGVGTLDPRPADWDPTR